MGAVVIDGEVRASIGFGRHGAPEAFAAADRDADQVDLPGIGSAYLVYGELNKADGRESADARLIVGRLTEEYAAEEDQMLRGMALVLGLVLDNLHTLQVERSRHQLVETLLEIQRAISAHRPLGELLDAITAGASALLDGCPVALLLTDPIAPGTLMAASVFEFPDVDDATLATVQELAGAPRRGAGHGARRESR